MIEKNTESKVNERNTIYKDKMHNEEWKYRFLSQYPEGTQRTYKRVFLISRGLEETWEKDLVDFTLEEISELLRGMKPLTTSASRANIATVYSYIRWAIENGYRSTQSNIHPLAGIRNNPKFIRDFVTKDIQLYISKQEVDDICFPDLENPLEGSYLINSQDSALLYALFSGITAKQIQHMKKEDICDDNTVFLRNEDGSFVKSVETGETFKLEISQECAELLKKAAKSEFYYFKNGNPSENAKMDSVELADNEYVFRVGKTRNRAPLEPMAYHGISRRIKEVAEFVANPHLTPKNINKSAYLYEGYKLWVEAGKPNYPDGKLTTEQYQAILKKFNFPKTNSGHYSTIYLRDYVTLYNIKQYYEED